MTAAAERHLLFGLLALHTSAWILTRPGPVAAFQAWTREKSKSLADHLEARRDLTSATRALLEKLVDVHVEAHGHDIENSLAAVPTNRSTRVALGEVVAPEVDATLARISRSKNNGSAAQTMMIKMPIAQPDFR